ncbi:RnfABCDGE type electron transport complex subunit B [Anaerospora hongkongensis]|uniref:RnfABCDGE type electron transport complex subunit B n=1 Tax=Anaerospora hongkongensis TaxID=244830 RepID=UPI00289888C7|nr:Fe-S cluster domain-containing protein [Anaerospora hongkongensis]
MSTSMMILVVLTTLGLVFGFVLAYANRKFAIEINPLIHIVEDVLPKGQCGACGYAGCQAYAEAVVLNPDVSPNLCIPGKEPIAKAVAELTGKAAADIEPRIAQVKCAGSEGRAVKAYQYEGISDCVAASLLFGGQKSCKYGCLGLGTCVRNCPFDAMTMSAEGLPVINPAKCTGCGKCETVCPKQVIAMMPLTASVRVNCNSKDKGAVARKVCTAACIACSLCMRQCPHGAITMESNLAVVNPEICRQVCTDASCLTKCPTKAIRPAVLGLVPGTESQASVEAVCVSCRQTGVAG